MNNLNQTNNNTSEKSQSVDMQPQKANHHTQTHSERLEAIYYQHVHGLTAHQTAEVSGRPKTSVRQAF